MKKIFLSLAVIAVVATVAVGATRAYFSDTATSTGNTFSAGTLDLKLTNNGEETDWDNKVSNTWVSPTNWAPGQEVTATIHMTNIGSIDSHHVYFGFNSPTNSGGTNGANLMDKIIVTKLTERYNDKTTSDQTAALASQIGDRAMPLTLKELVDFAPAGYGFYSWDDQTGDGVILGANDKLRLS